MDSHCLPMNKGDAEAMMENMKTVWSPNTLNTWTLLEEVARDFTMRSINGDKSNEHQDIQAEEKLVKLIGIALQPPTAKEVKRCEQNHGFLQRHSHAAPKPEDATEGLNMGMDWLWLEGLDPMTVLMWWQVTAVAWLVNTLERQSGCILGDEMGLGKTLSVLAFLCEVNNQRNRGSNEWGESKTVIIIAPQSTTPAWKATIERFLNPKYSHNLIEYVAGRGAKTLTKTFLQSLKHPDLTFILTTPSFLPGRNPGVGANPLQHCFSFVVIDESHGLKYMNTNKWKAIHSIDAPHIIDLSGTPADNHYTNLKGQLALIIPDSLWETIGVPKHVNPFEDFPDKHPNAILRATVHAFVSYIETEAIISRRAELVAKVYEQVLLKRRYGCMVDGRKVGGNMPPMKTTTIHISIHKDEKDKMNQILSENRKGLYFEDEYGQPTVNSEKARNLVLSATWTPLGYLKWDAADFA